MAAGKAKQKPPPAGPRGLTGSDEAKRKAAVILEALCGLRSTQAASDELGIAVVRYYVLETRMMQAMIDALEPQARGRKRSFDQELTKAREERVRLEREVLRLQALYRVTQRAVGVRAGPGKSGKSKSKAKSKGEKTRRVRRQSRGERVLKVLREGIAAPDSPSVTVPGDATSNQGGA